jgi:hypothetical protein
MTECCELKASNRIPPKRACCPVNGKEYNFVGVNTILRHLAEPWHNNLKYQSYYYCTDANCDVVYFGQDESIIKKSALRTKVGVKNNSPERSICYCFGVSYITAKNDETVKEFVTEMTRQFLCSCETSNPSGRCCLKDFPKQ